MSNKSKKFLMLPVLMGLIVVIVSIAAISKIAAKYKAQPPAQEKAASVDNLYGFRIYGAGQAKKCTGIDVIVRKGEKVRTQKILANKEFKALGEALCAGFYCESECVPVSVTEIGQ